MSVSDQRRLDFLYHVVSSNNSNNKKKDINKVIGVWPISYYEENVQYFCMRQLM
jgi:hypothetical protein